MSLFGHTDDNKASEEHQHFVEIMFSESPTSPHPAGETMVNPKILRRARAPRFKIGWKKKTACTIYVPSRSLSTRRVAMKSTGKNPQYDTSRVHCKPSHTDEFKQPS
mmetsp:Transcript_36283/g.96437  ORF Transcript_36283/g.96437 Transcript_36283/m.96437 type:complete len:107 (+) Transcript_36283:131-451(+)